MKALLMLQQNQDRLGMLPLASVFHSTIQYEKCGWISNPSVILASNLKSTWQYVVKQQGGLYRMNFQVLTCMCLNSGWQMLY